VDFTRRRLLTAAAAITPTTWVSARDGPSETQYRDALRFFAAADLNFEVLFAIGESAYGAGEAGETLATVNAINAAGASYQNFYDAFGALAARLGAFADRAIASGDRASSRSAYLRSAQYDNQALFFVLGTRTPNEEAKVYRRMETHWADAARLFSPPFEPVQIPFEGSAMPGWFLSGGSGQPRPTLIVMNGSDAQTIDTYAFGGAAAVERGWNALLFEGPGQGSMLFEREIPFRPDWETVITPIIDFLLARKDVDAARIALTGWSFGGALVTRAAAFEPRLAAVCADPGYLSIWDTWPTDIRQLAESADKDGVNALWEERFISNMTPQQRFTVAKRAEIFGLPYLEAARAGRVFPDLWTFAETLKAYDIEAIAPKVRTPMLVTEYERDGFVPGGGKALFDLLTCPKTFRVFTTAEGASEHCAPLAPQLRNSVIFDWLASTLNVH
jgi:hypothetical protein